MLTFIENIGYFKKRRLYARYLCECGNECIKDKCSVNSGNIKSCGCLKKKWQNGFGLKFAKHGLSNHPLHKIWDGIKGRCYNPNYNNYHNYGGRGVIMCDEWKNDFKSFYDWCIANGWKAGLEIDKDKKIPGNLIYSSATCTIMTPLENSVYTRKNTIIEFNGEKMPLKIIANKYGMSPNQLSNRLAKGWTIKDALTRKLSQRRKRNKREFINYTFGIINY